MLVFVLNQHGYKCRSIQTYNSVSGSNRLCSRSYSLIGKQEIISIVLSFVWLNWDSSCFPIF